MASHRVEPEMGRLELPRFEQAVYSVANWGGNRLRTSGTKRETQIWAVISRRCVVSVAIRASP